MADEEVDWGMDEPVDEMRQGESVPTGEKEDEISLEGLDGGNESMSIFRLHFPGLPFFLSII